MGVLGLWQILSSTGRPVTLESLENQVLAVDVSLWLNQAVRGVRERRGITISDAHLLVMFNRICKLLHYRIKPIFIFDGPPPVLKQRLLERRRRLRSTANEKVQKLSVKLMENLLRQQAVGNALAKKSGKVRSPEKIDSVAGSLTGDMYALPEQESEAGLPGSSHISSDSDEEITPSSSRQMDLEEIDINSPDFKALPPEVKHEILLELQAQRKRPSWKHVDRLPQDSEKFSTFQIDRLMKRRVVQRTIDSNAKEMNSRRTDSIMEELNGKISLAETQLDVDAKRIASSDSEHYLLFKRKSDHLRVEEISVRSDATDTDSQQSCIVIDDDSLDDLPVEENEDAWLEEAGIQASLLESSRFGTDSGVDLDRNDHSRGCSVTSSQLEVSVRDCVPDVPKPVDPTQSRILMNLQKLGGLKKRHDAAPEVVFTVNRANAPNSPEIPHPGTSRTFPASSAPYVARQVVEFSSDEETEPVRAKWDTSESDGDFEEVPEKSAPSSPIQPVAVVRDGICSVVPKLVFNVADTEAEASTSKVLPDVITVDDGPSEEPIDSFLDRSDDDIFASIYLDAETVPELVDLGEESQEIVELNDETESQGSQPEELSVDELESLHTHLQTEGEDVRAERRKEERVAASVTEQLRMECQELLQLFGIPFVNSPGEAEAQCAYMDATKQCHGTITDDSDIWLFGGRKVYKNFFNQQRLVEAYNIDDIQSQLGLTREKLIAFGLLTGSDYTEGLDGVGGVRAIEIMAEFSGGTDSLQDFRIWYDAVQDRRKSGDLRPESKLRAHLADLTLPDIFPDKLVIKAYQEPDVDQSADKFTWGVPALDLLREYTRRRFGWNQAKTDGVLLPIIKRLNSRDTQTHLESFFKIQLKQTNPLGVNSRRFGAAIKKMKKNEHDEGNGEDDDNPQPSTKRALADDAKEASAKKSKGITDCNPPKPRQTRSRKSRTNGHT